MLRVAQAVNHSTSFGEVSFQTVRGWGESDKQFRDRLLQMAASPYPPASPVIHARDPSYQSASLCGGHGPLASTAAQVTCPRCSVRMVTTGSGTDPFVTGGEALDLIDPDEEPTQPGSRAPKQPSLTYDASGNPVCDCGARVTKTTHAPMCTLVKLGLA